MKLNMTRLTLFLSLSFLFAGLAPIARAGTCSTATVAGEWGFTLTGTLLPPSGPVPAVPAGAVGTATLSVNGNVYGTEARNVGGDFAKETAKGTYTVNANCTGTMTVNFFEAGQLVRTSVLSLVFDDNSTQFRMVQKSLTLPDGTQVPVVITVEGRKH
jgi:hypothetical protein